jgi:hypothetical protein
LNGLREAIKNVFDLVYDSGGEEQKQCDIDRVGVASCSENFEPRQNVRSPCDLLSS